MRCSPETLLGRAGGHTVGCVLGAGIRCGRCEHLQWRQRGGTRFLLSLSYLSRALSHCLQPGRSHLVTLTTDRKSPKPPWASPGLENWRHNTVPCRGQATSLQCYLPAPGVGAIRGEGRGSETLTRGHTACAHWHVTRPRFIWHRTTVPSGSWACPLPSGIHS